MQNIRIIYESKRANQLLEFQKMGTIPPPMFIHIPVEKTKQNHSVRLYIKSEISVY